MAISNPSHWQAKSRPSVSICALAAQIETEGRDLGSQCTTLNRYPCFSHRNAYFIPLPRQPLPTLNAVPTSTHRTEPPTPNAQTSRSRTSQSLSSFLSLARLPTAHAWRLVLFPQFADHRNAVSGFCRANKHSAARSSLQGVFRTAKG